MPRPFSFTTTVRHFFSSAVGRTHASSVIPVVRSSEAESAIDTKSFTPSNESAEPVFAVVVQVAPEIDAVLPCPEMSATVLPLPASKEYAATRPLALSAVEVGAAPEPPTMMMAISIAANNERGRLCAIQLGTASRIHGGGGPPQTTRLLFCNLCLHELKLLRRRHISTRPRRAEQLSGLTNNCSMGGGPSAIGWTGVLHNPKMGNS